MLVVSLEIAFLAVFIPVWLSYEYFQRKTGVAVFPTMPPMRRKIIEILKQDFASRGLDHYTVIDLGSGSGQLSWRIARALPEAHVIGLELSYVPWLRSVLRQKLFGPKNLSYERVNFWAYDIGSAHAVTIYLTGNVMEKVGEKLDRELKPGTLVAVNTFGLHGAWEPFETHAIHVPMKVMLRLYRKS